MRYNSIVLRIQDHVNVCKLLKMRELNICILYCKLGKKMCICHGNNISLINLYVKLNFLSFF